MPDFPDDPTSALPAESESASPSTPPAENGPAGNDPESGKASPAEAPRFARRRRRRPRRSRPDQAIAEDEGQVEAPTVPGDAPTTADLSAPPSHRRRRRRHRGPRRDAAAVLPPTDERPQIIDGAPEVPPSVAQPAGESTDQISPESFDDATRTPTAESRESKPDSRPRRRRRRRRGAGSVEAAPVGDAPQTESAPADIREGQADVREGTRTRGPRQRRGPVGGRPERMPRSADGAEGGPARGWRGPRGEGAERRDRGSRDRRERGRGRPGEAERRRGRGRDETKKQVEQRLYAREAVVDRGFEDVTDEAGDGEPRRVHWTIIKRMVADQQSGKAISAVYVLQRDGFDTEFPNLGTARAEVNKTIVHPEKLTLSKAEHAAAKGDGDDTPRNRRQR
jgi:hypothetical protein